MLKSLNIENIAVIEKADMTFSPGLNVMTGETGAGKSIVVDAINAVLGERTSRELVRHGETSANVTALFEDVGEEAQQLLEEMALPREEDGTLVIGRRITAQGKSTCRVNGAPCTVSMLRELGARLINLHGQHDSQALLNPEAHYRFIDMMSDNQQVLESYQQAFRQFVAIRRQLKALTADADDKDRQLELLQYEIAELTEADIQIGEWALLKQRRELMLHAKSITEALQQLSASLTGDEEFSGVQTLLASSEKALEPFSAVDGALGAICAKLTETNDELEALKDMAAGKLTELDYSDGELERIEERLDLLYRFSNKYGETEAEMLAYLDAARARKTAIDNSDEEIARLNMAYDSALEDTLEKAARLTAHRKATAAALERQVTQQLQYLDMPKIQFVTRFEKGNLSSVGCDRIEFLISTNPGEPPKPLSKIASGGELSRIMLAIKSIIAGADSVDTLIFDEIDTGVSGRASRKIGYRLRALGRETQVICVTHAAQIASCADNHLLIKKEFADGRTFTSVTPLSREERVRELARIMGGIHITDTLLQSAEELLQIQDDESTEDR